jgi:hypothetical protein
MTRCLFWPFTIGTLYLSSRSNFLFLDSNETSCCFIELLFIFIIIIFYLYSFRLQVVMPFSLLGQNTGVSHVSILPEVTIHILGSTQEMSLYIKTILNDSYINNFLSPTSIWLPFFVSTGASSTGSLFRNAVGW